MLIIIAGSVYVYNSKAFERNAPSIAMQNNGYWNIETPLEISISDASGLKSYKVVLKTSKGDINLNYEQFMVAKQSIKINVEPARSAFSMQDKNIKIVVEATDYSKWNFFSGNRAVTEYNLQVDRLKPQLSTIAHSTHIKRGGSALVIFKASDENLKEIYIQTNYGKNFIPQPFYKSGYYISLVAWPVDKSTFRATIIAKDSAENISKTYIPLYLKENKYKVSKIKITDKFLYGKIAELADEFVETHGVLDSLEQFKIINEDVRLKNEKLIHEITAKVSNEMIDDFKINKLNPLEKAVVVAHFGDHRIYTYNGKDVSESDHLGIDMASFAMAKIRPQNDGEVVFADFNGLYGNMPIINHGLGLHTIYGHCSYINVASGTSIKAGSNIANTGKSGYAMGDHLHFGVLVQGIEVRPAEWMDSTWIKLNIDNVIKSAKETIDRG